MGTKRPLPPLNRRYVQVVFETALTIILAALTRADVLVSDAVPPVPAWAPVLLAACSCTFAVACAWALSRPSAAGACMACATTGALLGTYLAGPATFDDTGTALTAALCAPWALLAGAARGRGWALLIGHAAAAFWCLAVIAGASSFTTLILSSALAYIAARALRAASSAAFAWTARTQQKGPGDGAV